MKLEDPMKYLQPSPRETRVPHRRVTSSAALDRRRQAVEYRLAGHTYQHIADELGFRSHSGARKAVETALRDAIREPSEEVITQELLRLDRLLMGLWANATSGNVAAVDRVLKIMERRARLLGLDQATKLDVTAHDVDDLDAQIEQLVAELAGREDGAA